MSVTLLIDPDKSVRPTGAIRCDVAWKLFMPESMGDIPGPQRSALNKMTNWLWRELSEKLGCLRQEANDDVFIITPVLTVSAREYLIRICSMWSDFVYSIYKPDERTNLTEKGENNWVAPKVSLSGQDPDSDLLRRLIVEYDDSTTFFFMHALGAAKSYMRTYTIRRDRTYSRHHSHSAVEEHYLVLEGEGTLRYGEHSVPLRGGDIVSKPVGPDNSTQFIADMDKGLKILDIEIWPDTGNESKDLVLYPDHKELLMRGQGWSGIVQSDSIIGISDFATHYDSGYERKSDGSWIPKKIPGMLTRQQEEDSD